MRYEFLSGGLRSLGDDGESTPATREKLLDGIAAWASSSTVLLQLETS